MHPNRLFNWTDRDEMRAFVRVQSFGALFLGTPEGPRVAHAPSVWLGEDALGLHLARANALTPHLDSARALFVVQGPHGYISPDWYGLDDQVPTWNYMTVELEGIVRRMDDAGLMAQLDALAAEHESRLAPKAPWTRDKMTPGLVEKMAKAIVGFSLEIAEWRGTIKLGQNKSFSARQWAADGLDAAGKPDLAALLRGTAAGESA